ncbi:MAG: DUF4232 domain-containing protein [Nocardioides sp.]
MLGAVVLLGGLVAAGPQPALAAAAAPCHADDLALSKAGQEGAAGNRYLDIRIRNVTDTACRLTGFPTFTWRRHGHEIGWPSVPEPGQSAHTVVIPPGQAAFTTLHWVDPAPVPAAQCRPRRATGLHMTMPYRPHVYRFALRAKVCTTKQYRPMAFPVRRTVDLT